MKNELSNIVFMSYFIFFWGGIIMISIKGGSGIKGKEDGGGGPGQSIRAMRVECV